MKCLQNEILACVELCLLEKLSEFFKNKSDLLFKNTGIQVRFEKPSQKQYLLS